MTKIVGKKFSMPRCFNEKTKPSLYCPGCGQSIFLKHFGFVVDELMIQNRMTLGIDIGCSLLAWNFFNFDIVQTHHGRSVPVAVGYKLSNSKRIVTSIMGDGGGYAIGLQSLLHAAFRNNPISVFLLNNTGYSMTGGQMAPTSIPGEITTTSPEGKDPKTSGKAFHGPELIRQISDNKAYIGRASASNPILLQKMIKKALENQIKNSSFSFLEILTPCPTNWKTNAKESFKFLSVLEKEFPIGEVIKNEK
jgi:2-oxoglutarate/2-oxoacid ferredoxin oxidoreductase subunit beta